MHGQKKIEKTPLQNATQQGKTSRRRAKKNVDS
jgi:hypothetical protein